MSAINDASPPLAVCARELSFGHGDGPSVLDLPNLDVARGERLFVCGPSGSGKSTLLDLLAGIHAPRSGSLLVLEEPLHQLSAAARDRLRGERMGYVFQLFNLLPYLTVRDNIALPCRLERRRRRRLQGPLDEAVQDVAAALAIEPLLDRPARALSVGQQQRVAAARALIGDPELVLADEPTSALDRDLAEALLDLMLKRCQEVGAALVFVSHDRSLADAFDRVLEIAPHPAEAALEAEV